MLHVIDHPLIKHKLTIMRNKETGTKDFHQNLDEIAALMVYDITRDLKTRQIDVETPICKSKGYELSSQIVLVPILRAGLGMVNGIRDLIPTAKIGHIGYYRDEETLAPQYYYDKVPSNTPHATVFIVDPMLATGGSAVAAIDRVKSHGAKDIKLVCLVGVQEGVDNVMKHHPDVEIYLAALDEKLNDVGYIVPGLGDAGDRLFGTK